MRNQQESAQEEHSASNSPTACLTPHILLRTTLARQVLAPGPPKQTPQNITNTAYLPPMFFCRSVPSKHPHPISVPGSGRSPPTDQGRLCWDHALHLCTLLRATPSSPLSGVFESDPRSPPTTDTNRGIYTNTTNNGHSLYMFSCGSVPSSTLLAGAHPKQCHKPGSVRAAPKGTTTALK